MHEIRQAGEMTELVQVTCRLEVHRDLLLWNAARPSTEA